MAFCEDCDREFSPVLPSHKTCRFCYFRRKGDYDMAMAEEAWEKGYALGYERGLKETAK